MESIIQKSDRYITHTYGRNQVALVRGKGCYLYDENDNAYLDFGAGVAVNALGICDDGWVNSVTEQAKKIGHTSNMYYNVPSALLAEQLCTRTNMKNLFFSNSGAEAVETAIKAARKYSYDKYGENRNEIITLKNSFHGRTMAALTATGQDAYHKFFMPFLEGFRYAEANNLDSIKENINQRTCAIMVELIQGEGGLNVLTKDFVEGIARICKEKDILFIVDEIQTGIGRTGKLYCYMHYDFQPDIITTAKGLAGGLPIGATIFGEKTQNTLGLLEHGATFGGNPICCNAALYTLSKITDTLMENVAKHGKKMMETIKGFKKVKSVCGLGLMIGVELDNLDSKEVMKECLENGLLVLTAKKKIRLIPPLVLSDEEVDEGLAILKKVLD